MPGLETFMDTLTLVAGHSLITPNQSEKFNWCKDGSCKVQNKDNINKFGLFENTSLGFNDFYVNVRPEDLVPKEGDLINPIFRALSQTVVRKYAPIDFSKKGVLEASVNKLQGATIFVDHDIETDNVLGSVKAVEWQKGYTVDGLKVPAGINATLQIDGKSHPTIARGLAMDPPAYHSVSVTVSFKWEWSHPQLDNNDMWALWGTMADNNGKMELVRRVVTEIVMYSEISIVPLGADPFARLLKDGKITNPGFVKDRASLSESMKEMGIYNLAQVDYKQPEQFSYTITNPKSETDMELTQFMAALGLPEDTKLEQLKLDIAAGVTAKDSLASLTAKKEGLNVESLQTLMDNQKTDDDKAMLTFVSENGGTDSLKEVIEFQQTKLAEDRAEAVKYYKLVNKDSFKQEIVDTIENSNGETLKAFTDQFKEEFETKVPLTCQACGSEDVSRKASAPPDTKDKLSLKEELYRKQMEQSIGRIHGTKAE